MMCLSQQPDLYPPVVKPAVFPKTANLPVHAATTTAPEVPHVSCFLKMVYYGYALDLYAGVCDTFLGCEH